MKTHVLESLFNKGLQLYEKEFPTQMLPVNIAKFLWSFFYRTPLVSTSEKKLDQTFFTVKVTNVSLKKSGFRVAIEPD